MTLPQKVRALRQKKGWTQSDLARAAGIPQPTIWRLENGSIDHPKADTLVALARALGVPVDLLVHDDYEAQPADMVRSDADLRGIVETYLRSSEEDRRLLKTLVQHLRVGGSERTDRPYPPVAVKPRRVRKE